jgi:hypothetical protein
VQVPYEQEQVPESLASRKLVWGDPCSEGSDTAKSGTDEQKRYKRREEKDKCSQQHNVPKSVINYRNIER